MLKRLLLVLVLVGSVSAEELTVRHYRSFPLGADTVAARGWADTVYSKAIDISPFHNLWFQVYYGTSVDYRDSNFVNDTCVYNLQTSNDRLNWTSYGTSLGTVPIKSADLDSLFNSSLKINRDSTITGNFMRLQLIYRDTLEANSPSLIGTTYGKVYRVWLITTK